MAVLENTGDEANAVFRTSLDWFCVSLNSHDDICFLSSVFGSVVDVEIFVALIVFLVDSEVGVTKLDIFPFTELHIFVYFRLTGVFRDDMMEFFTIIAFYDQNYNVFALLIVIFGMETLTTYNQKTVAH